MTSQGRAAAAAVGPAHVAEESAAAAAAAAATAGATPRVRRCAAVVRRRRAPWSRQRRRPLACAPAGLVFALNAQLARFEALPAPAAGTASAAAGIGLGLHRRSAAAVAADVPPAAQNNSLEARGHLFAWWQQGSGVDSTLSSRECLTQRQHQALQARGRACSCRYRATSSPCRWGGSCFPCWLAARLA